MDTCELYHHGILGQKHGKRNAAHYPLNQEDFSEEELKNGAKESSWAQESDEGPEKKTEPQKPIVKDKNYYKSKKASELTDEEINAAIRRIQIEDQYDKMTGQNQPIEKKESYGKKLVTNFAKKTVETFANEAAGKIGRNVASAMFDQAMENAKKAREKEEAAKKEREDAKKEKKMIKSVEKKMLKKGGTSNLSSKELEFYAKRYDQEEKVNKLFDIDEAGIKKAERDNDITDISKTLLKTKDREVYKKTIDRINKGNASDVKTTMETLNKIKDSSALYYNSNKNKNNNNNNLDSDLLDYLRELYDRDKS